MPLTCIMTSTKSSQVSWFKNSSEDNAVLAKNISDWTKLRPGLVSTEVDTPDENTWTFTIVFDTVDNYSDWRTSRVNLPEFQIRAAYNAANGITSVVTESIT